MGLSGGRLPIGKHRTVKAFQHTIDDWLGAVRIDFFLRRIHVKCAIEVEVVVLGFVVSLLANDYCLVVVEFVNCRCAHDLLLFVEWAESHHHSNITTALLGLKHLGVCISYRYYNDRSD